MRDGRRAVTMMDLSSKEYAMRSYCARGVLFTLGFVLAGSVGAQDIGSPSLLPVSAFDESFSTFSVAHSDKVVAEAEPGPNPAATDVLPSPLPSPSDSPIQAGDDYKQAMNQSWGDGACGGCGCGGGRYWFGSVGGLI